MLKIPSKYRKILPPYWFWHGVVSVLITLPFMFIDPIIGAMSCGFWFYVGREIRDVEKLHKWNWRKFDWKGLGFPLLLYIIAVFWYKMDSILTIFANN